MIIPEPIDLTRPGGHIVVMTLTGACTMLGPSLAESIPRPTLQNIMIHCHIPTRTSASVIRLGD